MGALTLQLRSRRELALGGSRALPQRNRLPARQLSRPAAYTPGVPADQQEYPQVVPRYVD